MSRVRYIELEEFAYGELPMANIRCLVPEETYAMLELIETRTRHGATIFCTQFET